MNQMPLGACLVEGGGCEVRVWAPHHEKVAVRVEGDGSKREQALHARPGGYHEAVIEDMKAGDRYSFRLGEELLRPDPASRAQPDGVHDPSMVVEPSFEWTDHRWRGLPLSDYVFYEVHVGTFTEEGTFDAVVDHLDDLVELGVTCVEIMPVAQFPGARNWGYDGVQIFAAQWSYGGIDGLRRLVDACHARGLAVCLDVVYNHLGPEGNYLRDFGPYFTGKYTTPWGEALNFDDAYSDEVRRFFIENARWWIEDVHIDALRLDAVHAIFDQSAVPFLEELATSIRELGERMGRRVHVIAESDLHDPKMVRPPEIGGHWMHAEWNDDLHHAIHALLTKEKVGYYADFGSVEDLAAAYNEGYAHAGKWTPHRKRRYGARAADIPRERFVVCVQNHDQTGNRFGGDRLSTLVSFESLKLAASAMLLSPSLPLLFMGEEYGEENPFLYFVDHGDPSLVKAVRRGRAAEFASFGWKEKPPDPASESTFERSRLDRSLREREHGSALRSLYKELLSLRRRHPALGSGVKGSLRAFADPKRNAVWLHREGEGREIMAVLGFGEQRETVTIAAASGSWRRIIDTTDVRWAGPGSDPAEVVESDGEITLRVSGRSCVVLERER